MEHGGLWSTVHLGNVASFWGSIRAVKLELSHIVRIEVRKGESLVMGKQSAVSVELTGPRPPLLAWASVSDYIYTHTQSSTGRQTGMHASTGDPSSPKSLLDMSYP